MLDGVDEPGYRLAIFFLDWLILPTMHAFGDDSIKVFFSLLPVILTQVLEFLLNPINIPVRSIPDQQLAFNVREAGHIRQST